MNSAATNMSRNQVLMSAGENVYRTQDPAALKKSTESLSAFNKEIEVRDEDLTKIGTQTEPDEVIHANETIGDSVLVSPNIQDSTVDNQTVDDSNAM